MRARAGRACRGGARQKGETRMIRLLKVLGVLVILGAIGLVGYAYLGDLSPEQEDLSIPVELDAG